MKYLVVLLFLVTALYGQCPLGFSPEEACVADDPSCALFTDINGENLCDNAAPPGQSREEEPEEVTEPEPEPEQEQEQEQETESEVLGEVEEEEEEIIDPFCPLNLAPEDACPEDNARCTFYTDSNGDILCDNPGPQPLQPEEETEPAGNEDEQSEPQIDPEETEGIEEPLVEEDITPDADSMEVVSAAEEDITETDEAHSPQQGNSCPLRYTVEEACDADNPDCAFYTDFDENDFCDNPGERPGQGGFCAEPSNFSGLQTPTVVGCPLGLPPAAACPDSLALCPHWYGVTSRTSCSNPSGGQRRINIILITLGVLLPVSTFLSRKFYGRRLKDRLKRNSAHMIIRGVSLMILGFGVQGCFCPLGTFQYAFTAEGLAFLGLSGILIFALPLVFSAFFGRVFCGWVCPFGALQEFLYRIHVPGRFSPSGKIHHMLKHLTKVILFALIAVILLNRFDVISLQWPVPFCSIDPFHTIFTLFLSGSLIVAGATIILSIFIRRFFCKYFCFYGAAQAILSRLTLWNRIKGIRAVQPEIDSDEEFDK